MLRVLLLCSLAACALGVDVPAPVKVKYAQRTRSLLQASKLLNEKLPTKANYTLRESTLHYVVLLGVGYVTVLNNLPKDPNLKAKLEKELLDNLQRRVPDLLEQPQDVVNDMKATLNTVLEKSRPVVKLVKQACDDLADDECNKVVDKLVNTVELKKSAKVLDLAGQVGDELLAKEPRLQEVAQGLDILPYVLDNRKAMVDYLALVVDLFAVVYPLPR